MREQNRLVVAAVAVCFALVAALAWVSSRPPKVEGGASSATGEAPPSSQEASENSGSGKNATSTWFIKSVDDQLSGDKRSQLSTEQWNPERTIKAQIFVTCEETDKWTMRDPPDAALKASIRLFGVDGEPLPLLWQAEPRNILYNLNRTVSLTRVTRDGGETVVDDQVVQGQYLNAAEVTFGYFVEGGRFTEDGKSSVAGEYRVELTANNGQRVVVKLPTVSDGEFSRFASEHCPTLGQAPMDALFKNTIVLTHMFTDTSEWGRLYYEPDGRLRFVDPNGRETVGTWRREGRNLCGVINGDVPVDLKPVIDCEVYRQFKKTSDFQTRYIDQRRGAMLTLESGRPSSSADAASGMTSRYTDADMSGRFGNTVVSSNPDGSERVRAYYDADGKVRFVSPRGGRVTGTWKIEGGRLCLLLPELTREKECMPFEGPKSVGDTWTGKSLTGGTVIYGLRPGRPREFTD